MKKILILVFSLLFSISYSQQTGIPYRVGTKFGVATVDGKMIIPAEYDIIEPEKYDGVRYLTAYTISGNTVLSTLIYNNKIILKNQTYGAYYIISGLIQAQEYKVLRKSDYHSDKNYSETEYLYDLKGNKIFPSGYKSISLIDDMAENEKLNVMLIYTYDLNAKESLYLYDKKLKKITKTFIDNAQPIDANFDWQDDYRKRTITNIYVDKNGKGRKMILEIKNNTIVVQSETEINYRAEKQKIEERYSYGDPTIEVPYEQKIPPAPINSEEEKIITTVRKVERKRGFYYLPKQIEELKITNEKLKKEDRYIVSKNGKQGLYTVYNNSYVIPIGYDEIIFADFESQSGGYILKNNNKFGVYLYGYPESKIIEPVFDYIPLLVDEDYFGKKMPLFKLYDENGKLLCYANEKGKLFYKQ